MLGWMPGSRPWDGAVSSETEAAYRRGNLLKKRRLMMDEWAAYCEGELAEHGLGSTSSLRPPVGL